MVKMERMCSECGGLFEIDINPRDTKNRDRLAEIGDMPYICADCFGYYEDEYYIEGDNIYPVIWNETNDNSLYLEDITVGMRFKTIYPVERGDGTEFPEGTYFRVVDVTPFWVQLRYIEGGSHWMVPSIALRENPDDGKDRFHHLQVTIETLTQLFKKLNSNE